MLDGLLQNSKDRLNNTSDSKVKEEALKYSLESRLVFCWTEGRSTGKESGLDTSERKRVDEQLLILLLAGFLR